MSVVLARHIGETLTPALAISLAKELLNLAENPLDLKQFVPMEYKGYTLQAERLEDILDEIHGLHVEHYGETETYRAGVPLNMDYEQLVDRERAGQVLQFTARLANTRELVGSMRVFLGQCIHTQTQTATLFAQDDVFFIKPAHRGGFLAVRLWQYADACGALIGVQQTFFDSKLATRADKLAKYLGYKPVAIKHAKVS